MPIASVKIQANSYRYFRIAMVALLIALAVAVFYQSNKQGSFLASVSAYYYTPAQAVFVGALIGLGVCMIALQGMNDPEDMFLNLGGLFAIMVAIVPTGRGADFRTAVQACRESGGTLLSQRASKGFDCPTVQSLVEATKANVENNMVALLTVGFLVIAASLFITAIGKGRTTGRWWFRAHVLVAIVVWLGGLIALITSVDWLVDNAHYLAAIMLFLSVVAVALANAYRREGGIRAEPNGKTGNAGKGDGSAVVEALKAPRYARLAITMLVVTGGLTALWLTNVISLFWVEILVAALFAIFWMVQTIELEAGRGDRQVRQDEICEGTARSPR